MKKKLSLEQLSQELKVANADRDSYRTLWLAAVEAKKVAQHETEIYQKSENSVQDQIARYLDLVERLTVRIKDLEEGPDGINSLKHRVSMYFHIVERLEKELRESRSIPTEKVYLIGFFKFDKRGSDYGFERMHLQRICLSKEEALEKISFCDEAGWYEGAVIEEWPLGYGMPNPENRIWLIQQPGGAMLVTKEPRGFENVVGLVVGS